MPARKVTSKLCQMAARDIFLHLPALRCDREDDLCNSSYTSDWVSERHVSSSLDPFHPFLAANRAERAQWWVTHVRQGHLHVLTSASGSGCQVPRHTSPTETEKTTSQWFISRCNHEIKGKGKVLPFSQFLISPVLAGVLLYIFSVSVLLFYSKSNMITAFSAKL